MTQRESTTATTAQVQRRLEQDAAGLDPDTVRALAAARARALAAGAPRSRFSPVWGAALAAGVALVAVVAFVVGRDPVGPAPGVVAGAELAGAAGAETVIADLDLLADDTELAMLEDLDFLAWLSTVDEEIS